VTHLGPSVRSPVGHRPPLGYLDQYGPEGAERVWFGGPGSVSKNGGARDVLGMSVDGYGKKFMSHFGGNAGAAQPGGDNYEAQGRALALGNGEPQYQAAATSADDGSDGPMASSSGAPGDSIPGMGASGFDPSAMTNEEIQAALGQQKPADTGSFDPSSMTDDQLRAAMGRPTGSLGQRAWKDVKDNVLGGPLAIAKRGVSDVGSALEGNFRPAAGDVLGIMKALNPLRAAWENAKTLGTAVQDPAAAARAVGQEFHDRPVSTSLAVAGAAAPLLGAGARLAGIGGRGAALIDGVGNLTTNGEVAFARADGRTHSNMRNVDSYGGSN
jgi:hypothetical protein